MSQQKVDQKKYDKTHRKSLVRKKKLEEALSITCVCVVAAFIVVWIGFSIYKKAEDAAEANATYEYYDVKTDAVQDYLNTLN